MGMKTTRVSEMVFHTFFYNYANKIEIFHSYMTEKQYLPEMKQKIIRNRLNIEACDAKL